MFVSKARDFVYPQSEHVKLATVIAEHWGNESFAKPPVPHDSFIKAVSSHDNGYGHYDMSAVGRQTEEQVVTLWRRCTEQNLSDPYTEIIIKRHFMRLTKLYGQFPLLAEFHHVLEGEVDKLCRLNSLNSHIFDVTDTVMNACDAISFSFCHEEPHTWELEVYTNPTTNEKAIIKFAVDSKHSIFLDPYPLDEVHIIGTLTAYDLKGYPKVLLPNEVSYQILNKQ